MAKCVLSLHDQATELQYPDGFQANIDLLFGQQPRESGPPPNHFISVQEIGPDRYSISGDTECPADKVLNTAELLDALLEDVVRSLIYDLKSAVALHAASMGWKGKSILIPGPTGAGKTSLAGWFAARNFEFLSDEVVVLPGTGRTTLSFPRPLLAKPGAEQLIGLLTSAGRGRAVPTAANTMICLDRPVSADLKRQAGLIIFPQFVSGRDLEFASVSPAMTGLKLMQCNLNARNLADHGLATLTAFARNVPALALTYGSFEQLEGVADSFAKFILESDANVASLKKFTAAFQSEPRSAVPAGRDAAASSARRPPVPEATPRKPPKKITIGMATYDDYDGVYFTLQAIRMYHPEILDDTEFVVIDNHPDGPSAQALKNLESWISNYRYVPKGDISGTAIRDCVFQEASGEIVICLDCHVFVVAGALQRLIAYFDAHPGTMDLLQGPLLYDNLTSISTHFTPKWQEGMFGVWDSSADGADPEQAPFEIPMQGLGLFACRRQAWPGFNPSFRGFGGEEGYIHEKFRQRGGRTLCLPFLRWMHRFVRPRGTPYANLWDDRIRNYWIGFLELGWDTAPIAEHFKMHLPGGTGARIVERLEKEFAPVASAPAETRIGQDGVDGAKTGRAGSR